MILGAFSQQAWSVETPVSLQSIVTQLNQARAEPQANRVTTLEQLLPVILQIEPAIQRTAFLLNLGYQAQHAGDTRLAYQAADAARKALQTNQPHHFHGEVYDLLGLLYEKAGRDKEALALTSLGLNYLKELKGTESAYLTAQLEWRKGRLHKRLGEKQLALASYLRATENLESVRMDLPIEDAYGDSTYSTLIKPLNSGLVGLLLEQANSQQAQLRQDYLLKARDTIEFSRQAEMQDFLGDRCVVESEQSGDDKRSVPVGVTVLYPVLLDDDLRLLVQTAGGIELFRVDVDTRGLASMAQFFAEQIRMGVPNYKKLSQRLYDFLIRPIESTLQQSDTLIVVPNGSLRLVPMQALHDGQQFLAEKLAVTTTTGMSMTYVDKRQDRVPNSLVAGLSEPGPVVSVLREQESKSILAPTGFEVDGPLLAQRGLAHSTATLRSIGQSLQPEKNTVTNIPQTLQRLRAALTLPGVKDEIQSISQILNGTALLDEGFTLNGFTKEAQKGQYRILHIASHGLFGGTAETSFILTYDDLLTLNDLEQLLSSDQVRQTPIDLLTLSACQTAEGNDRAPLGISGAAIKAQARSVLGTLWPVEDNTAKKFMQIFYEQHTRQNKTKAEAMRQAQLVLINDKTRSHPFFWAPFTLIGNWQ